MRHWISLLLLFTPLGIWAQTYSQQDSLRGSITAERAWWDLVYYHLDIEVQPESKTIKGKNMVQYKVLRPSQLMQIDLQPPLQITRVTQGGQELNFESNGNAHFISLTNTQNSGDINTIVVFYEGVPKEAVRAPWDGGISWTKDDQDKDFIASSCQGLGASVWWPCKDHMYDEVDSMLISVEVPRHLTNVSNGRLRSVDTNKKKKTKTFHWFVSNPINNYGVNINIGNYVNWKETYEGEKGTLDIDNWVLKHNLNKAKVHWQENHRMLKAFEHWFGPYPFYEDSYKLVEAPYLGMEHQSSVTYGNGFQNGYLGNDLSGTGWGLKFDFIIVHEAGHEWFANNITHRDAADMWLHEGFTAYSEGLFVEYHYGKEAGQAYTRGTRININNQFPMIGPYDVNYDLPDSDVYYKGANVLNTLRSVVNDDELWRKLLRGMNKEFYHQTISSQQMEEYIANISGLNLDRFFDQYLRDERVPIFEYFERDNNTFFRWTNCIEDFDMPLGINLNGENMTINPTTQWQRMEGFGIEIDPNFYVGVMKNQ